MDERQFRHLLDKYVQGKCTPEEIDLLHRFHDSFQEEALQDEPDTFDMWLREERIHKNIRRNIARKDKQQYEAQQAKTSSSRAWLKIAASVLLIIGLSLGSYMAYEDTPAPKVVWVQKSTLKGQKATIKLTDGTKVYLNADSRLSFPEHFGPGTREVTLEGEAFFEVTSDAERPFIIKSAPLTTTVLGTSFGIKAFTGEPLQVTVVTGKVKVSALRPSGQAEEVLLTPHEQAYDDGQLHKRAVDIDRYLAWKDKTISFDEATLAEAATVLERWFNVSIEISDEATARRRISGKYMDETLPNIMKSFQYILGVEYRFENGRKLIIGSKKHQPKK